MSRDGDEPEPELSVLARYLDAYRRAARWKVAGLDLEAATRRLVPSESTLLGIVKHLAYVERWWFQRIIDGRDVSFPDGPDDPTADFRIEPGETVESVLSLFDAECAVSREILAGHDDPALPIPFRDDTLALRDILIHLVEEISRHVGHMDILREQTDGSTGGFPPEGYPWSRTD